MRNIIKYFIFVTVITLIGCQAEAETNILTNDSVNNLGTSQWTCGVNAVCGTVSGIPSGTISVLVTNGTDFSTSGSNITNGKFMIPVPPNTNQSSESQPNIYNIDTLHTAIGNNSTFCQTTGNTYIMGKNNNNVQIKCDNTGYFIGGTIAGLKTGEQVVINGYIDGEAGFIVIYSLNNGKFFFSTAYANGSEYHITEAYANPPTGDPRNCTVNNAVGTINNANVTNIQVQC
ncbi:MAG: hypothetical protein RL017_758 [Pseudomonadota bacterium]